MKRDVKIVGKQIEETVMNILNLNLIELLLKLTLRSLYLLYVTDLYFMSLKTKLKSKTYR